MYINKCTKCGKEFETKNPKRIICPSCLYPDRKPILDVDSEKSTEEQKVEKKEPLRSYSFDVSNGDSDRPRPQRPYNPQQRPYNNNRPSYNNRNNNNNNNRRPNNNNQRGGFNKRPMGNRPPRPKRELLVNKEQLAQIEVLYKRLLPLPNMDAHEAIGAEIGLEPRKVFFGINLVRQKLYLPKLPFPKRKLAVSPEQMQAIRSLYEPLLPMPPIGCHKIIASQLKMDEWRVHVGIGLVRKQLGLDRWNEGRPDYTMPVKPVVAPEVKAETDDVVSNDTKKEVADKEAEKE